MLITLINPPGLKMLAGLQMHTPNPNLGLAYISAAIKQAGYEYACIDAVGEAIDEVHPYDGRDDIMSQGLSLEATVQRIPEGSKVVGIGCLFSVLWPMVRDLSVMIRERFPDALLILGGEHGTASFSHALSVSKFDVVVLGEGEDTIVNLIRAHEAKTPLADVKGIAFKSANGVINTELSARQRSIDGIVVPDWKSWPIEKYIDSGQINGVNMGRSMPILATRGCPYACSFCSSPQMWTRRWLARDPKMLINEMESYIRAYDVTNFDFQDLTFVINKRWTIDFCREIIDRELEITWQMPSGTRAEAFDEEVVDHLHRAGCKVLAFAPESGSEEILKATRKQVDLEKLKAALKIAVNRGLHLSCFFVLGFPDDNEQTLKETLRLVRKVAMIGVHDVAVTQFVPYPGSELFHELQASGEIELDDEFFMSPFNFYTNTHRSFSKHLDSDRLYRAMMWMFLNFYALSFLMHPFRTARILSHALFQGHEETRFAKWMMDRFFVRRRWRSQRTSEIPTRSVVPD
jgi:anaerobic magnesium-protoporphyrin IX monomethyl ester cyclase